MGEYSAYSTTIEGENEIFVLPNLPIRHREKQRNLHFLLLLKAMFGSVLKFSKLYFGIHEPNR